jgi:amidase
MQVSEYLSHDAVGLAQLVAQRDVMPAELLDAALARQAKVNPTLNAVVQSFEDKARATIADGLPQGPLSGIPFLLKDVTTQLRDVITTGGSRVFNTPAAADSGLVAAYKRAGLVIYGKSNTPEFGLMGITEPARYGTTFNPWNLEITCGGSSGGSMAPQGEGWGGMTCLHVVSRSVRDSAAALDASCQPQPGDPYSLPPPATPFLHEVGREPRKLRIGLLTTTVYGAALEAPVAQGVKDAAKLCESLGHTVEEVTPPPGMEALIPAAGVIMGAWMALNLNREAKRRGHPIDEANEIEEVTKVLYDRSKRNSANDYVDAMATMHTLVRQVAAWWGDLDVLLLSSLGTLPIPVGILKNGIGDIESLTKRFYNYGPNTQIFNMTGQPAMSVPLHWSPEGIPVGVQFAGRIGDEVALLRLAGQLERAKPWAQRRPPAIPW